MDPTDGTADPTVDGWRVIMDWRLCITLDKFRDGMADIQY